MIRLVASFLAFCALTVITVGPAHAQNPEPNKSPVSQVTGANALPQMYNTNVSPPDINSVAILSNIVKGGAKLHFMGERSGLFGWLIVKDGQIQMIYVTPDRKTALIGGMFSSDGDNVTGQQIIALAQINKEVADIMNGPAKQQEELNKINGITGVPGGTPITNKAPVAFSSPGDRLLQDLQAATGVTLGKNEQAEILMVMDPNCSHCQATWKELREAVIANRVQVRLIPVTNDPASDNTRAGAQLLKAANPLETWDKYVKGDKNVLAGDADQSRIQAVLLNNQLIEKWNIQSTPYLVYRAKDGKVKIVQGKPERMAAVITDLVK